MMRDDCLPISNHTLTHQSKIYDTLFIQAILSCTPPLLTIQYFIRIMLNTKVVAVMTWAISIIWLSCQLLSILGFPPIQWHHNISKNVSPTVKNSCSSCCEYDSCSITSDSLCSLSDIRAKHTTHWPDFSLHESLELSGVQNSLGPSHCLNGIPIAD